MRVLTCLTQEHSLWLVLLAALMCGAGSWVSVKLFHRTLHETGSTRMHWSLLSAVTAGAAIWATHFVAMLGYRPGVPVSFDATLTIVSALIAVAGTAAGLGLATLKNERLGAILGGAGIGLAISAMHYVGMFAYRVEGLVEWLPGYVAASVILSMAFGILTIRALQRAPGAATPVVAVALFVGAILTLHFTGMAAFTVTPIAGLGGGADSETFIAMASAIAMVALLIVGAGISTHLVERSTYTDSQVKLRHQALHDALTEIANRRAFAEALSAECRKLERYGRGFALLTIDLDRFKPVNDTLGHPVGDEVLRRVARRLRSAIREGDLLARTGGDEFAVIAYGARTSEEAEAVAARIVEVLCRPFVIDGQVAEIGASVGLCFAPDHGTDAEQLVHHADVALYTAKNEGRARFCLFRPELNDALQRRRTIEADLRRACMRDEFNVVYQPIIDAHSGECTGAEALLRWTNDDRGTVSPAEFIPIAEELGLVSRIGAGVLKQACFDATEWPHHLGVSVNISPIQLLDPRLPQLVSQALADSGLAATRLELEITETALLGNDEMAMKSLQAIRALGVTISLDDFGTGYSSLSYLHRFPISRIKIDKSFVQKVPTDHGSVSIIRAISQLGASMNMRVTAEGIETDEQRDFMLTQGCHNLQGFLIGRPVPKPEFVAFLSARQLETAP